VCLQSIWHRISSLNSEIPTTCKVTAILKAGHTVVGISLGKREAQTDISGQEVAEAFWKADGSDIRIPSTSKNRQDLHQSLICLGQVMFDGHPTAIIFGFRPSPTVCTRMGFVALFWSYYIGRAHARRASQTSGGHEGFNASYERIDAGACR
jgi:hypothetical protein